MESFEIIVGTCSILSFLVSLFVANKVIKINNNISVKGKDNITSGRDTKIKK
ncbi:hypothetical protein [Winogradskyella pacifica]|uniref:hypothetical protein n=1 Tax=Winogradskyella pacifica TaxID=664642 RepID=UPI0015CDF0A1|nr:hypothetical protein [Winogradskyella pacifica]